MCTSPSCPGGCRTTGRTVNPLRQRMLRAYVKVYDERRRQHAVPVGWWCPACHAFRSDFA